MLKCTLSTGGSFVTGTHTHARFTHTAQKSSDQLPCPSVRFQQTHGIICWKCSSLHPPNATRHPLASQSAGPDLIAQEGKWGGGGGNKRRNGLLSGRSVSLWERRARGRGDSGTGVSRSESVQEQVGGGVGWQT